MSSQYHLDFPPNKNIGFEMQRRQHLPDASFYLDVLSKSCRKMTDDITPLLLLDLEIPIPLEKEFTVPCCIRGYHIYRWKQWKAEIGSILTSEPEVRPGALVEDKYSIAVLDNGQTIGHVPKFLSQLIFFFLKYEGTLSIKVTGERRFSFDLPQGGMEIPADFVFKTVDAKLHNQMREKVLKELENFEGRRKVGIDKSKR